MISLAACSDVNNGSAVWLFMMCTMRSFFAQKWFKSQKRHLKNLPML